MNKIVVGIVAVVCLFGVVGVVVYGIFSHNGVTSTEFGSIRQQLVVFYEDGSQRVLPEGLGIFSLGITHQGKTVTKVLYNFTISKEKQGSLEVSIKPRVMSPLQNKTLSQRSKTISEQGKTFLVWNISVYDFINYNLNDGQHDLVVQPQGNLVFNNESIDLPGSIAMTFYVQDERMINVEWKPTQKKEE